MTETLAPPDGYVVRCACSDLPALTAAQAIIRPRRVVQCQACGVEWTSEWRRDPGGETQPSWVATASTPENWTPPISQEAK